MRGDDVGDEFASSGDDAVLLNLCFCCVVLFFGDVLMVMEIFCSVFVMCVKLLMVTRLFGFRRTSSSVVRIFGVVFVSVFRCFSVVFMFVCVFVLFVVLVCVFDGVYCVCRWLCGEDVCLNLCLNLLVEMLMVCGGVMYGCVGDVCVCRFFMCCFKFFIVWLM